MSYYNTQIFDINDPDNYDINEKYEYDLTGIFMRDNLPRFEITILDDNNYDIEVKEDFKKRFLKKYLENEEYKKKS